LIRNSILHGRKIETFFGKDINSIYVLLYGKGKTRSTCFAAVYGKSSPSAVESVDQRSSYSSDLQRIPEPNDCDFVFMGDINSRVGKPTNFIERQILGPYGESTRDRSGKEAVNFMLENRLVCLNNCRSDEKTSNFTYHQVGREDTGRRSIIDTILV